MAAEWWQNGELVRKLKSFKERSPSLDARRGNCYSLAFQFVLENPFVLVHGKIAKSEGLMDHARAENPEWIFEPVNLTYLSRKEWKEKSVVVHRYSRAAAIDLLAVTYNFGPWTAAERKLARRRWCDFHSNLLVKTRPQFESERMDICVRELRVK